MIRQSIASCTSRLALGLGVFSAAAPASMPVLAPAIPPALFHSGGPLQWPGQQFAMDPSLAQQAATEGVHGESAASVEAQAASAAWLQALAELECLELFTHTSVLEAARPLTDAEVMARFDRDHNGRLDATEQRASQIDAEARRATRADLVRRFDANGNRRLEAIEMSRARAEFVAQRRALLLDRFDVDQDGVLDPRERASIALERERAERLARLVPHFDRNGDGRLNSGEKHAMASFLAATPTNTRRTLRDALPEAPDHLSGTPSSSSLR